jgi:F420-dependent oxidoreductase-like protein
VQIGIQIPDFTRPEGAATLGPALANLGRLADDTGYSHIAVMDHFFQIRGVGPAENDMLEAYTALGFLAAATSRAKLVTLVTGVHYRAPGLLAKTMTTLDVLSQGRAWLGIGAGWNEEESVGLGFGFPSVSTRFEMLEETLQICLQMWSGDQSPYHGDHFQLQRTLNVPQALSRPHPAIMIGGGGEKKTLRFVAKYADACNLFATPDVGRKLDILREHCEREGRDYDSIIKTAYYRFDLGQGVGKILDDLKGLHDLGFQVAMGQIVDAWSLKPVETVASKIIPVAAAF